VWEDQRGDGVTLDRLRTANRPSLWALISATTRHPADGLDAEGRPCLPHVLALAHTRAGSTRVLTMLTEAAIHASPADITVGCEATGPDWLNLYEALIAQDSQVAVRNPLHVQARRGTTPRGPNTAPVEARLLAESLRRDDVPPSPGPEAGVHGWRDLTRWRADRVAQSGDVTRRLSSLLDRTCPELATGVRDVCGTIVRAILDTWAWPEPLAAVPTARLAPLSHGHVGAEQARAIKEAARQRVGRRRGAEALAFGLRLPLLQVRELERWRGEWDRAITRRYPCLDRHPPTLPGLGPATAPAISAEIGDLRRCTDSAQLVALVGVAPQLHEPGQTAGQAQMRKRGSPSLRRAIWHAALTACRLAPMCRGLDARQRQRGQHHLVALSPVANKLTCVISSVLKGQRPSEPYSQGSTAEH
jgi:transposase